MTFGFGDELVMDTIISNARIVARSAIFNGTVVIADGVIQRVDEGRTNIPGTLDFERDLLLPGLIEMHTDNLEKHLIPRPGILWPSPELALLSHDNQVIGAGITTVLDAVFLGEYQMEGMRRKILESSIEALHKTLQADLLRSDHLLHLRCEISDSKVVDLFETFADHPLVRLISVMDHTPGQRQWRDLTKYRQFHKDKNWTDEEFENALHERVQMREQYAATNRHRILSVCRERNLPVATHDDTTEAHCIESAEDGISISEFPTTLEAARKARELGMNIIMGAPNMVRGNSHSGNVSALALARENLLDGLSSDYFPSSLLHSAFVLNQQLDIPLHEAVAKISANQADMLGLNDRGEILIGKRADLIRVRVFERLPIIMAVWRNGIRVR
jgi:alpha-D-ribose 1-methylphosphonate 5-triphosphate diphosphatase